MKTLRITLELSEAEIDKLENQMALYDGGHGIGGTYSMSLAILQEKVRAAIANAVPIEDRGSQDE